MIDRPTARVSDVVRSPFSSTDSRRALPNWVRFVRVACASLVPLLLIAGGATEVGAVDVPVSAYSRSLGIDPILLYDHGDAYRFPQLAARESRLEILQTNANPTLGANLAWEHASVLVGLVQGYDLNPSVGGSALHVGWARHGEGIAVGVGGAVKHSDVRSHNSSGNASNLLRSYETEMEGSAGISFPSLRLDLAGTVLWDDRGVTRAEFTNNHIEIRREIDPKPRPGINARWRHPFSTTSELVLAAGWQDRKLEWNTVKDVDGREDSNAKAHQLGDEYFVQTLVAMSHPKVDRVYVYSGYRATRLPSFDAGSTSSRTGLNVSRVASAGLAIESELLKGFRAMAGIGGRYSYGRNDSSESTTSSSRKTETLNDSMTWGASYQYRRLQLTGQLASDLNLQDLFGTLDLVVTL